MTGARGVPRAAGLVLAAAAVLAAQTPPPADTPSPAADPRLQRIRERRAALERELLRLRGEEKSLLGEVDRLDLEVRLRGEQLAEAQAVLQRTSAALDETQRRARELEATVARERPVLAARARALYKLGDLSYVRLLLSVDRPSDLLRGYRFVSALARRDRQRVAGFRRDLDELQSARGELQRKTREAQALRSELARARAALDADRRRKSELLTSLVEKKELNAAYVKELEQAEARLGEILAGSSGAEVSVPIAAFRGELPWPAEGRVSGAFGRQRHPRFDTYTVRNGIEIAARAEAPVRAVHEGTVVFADAFRGYGRMVVIDHGDRHHTLYAQLGDLRVRTGDKVAAGTVIGLAGEGAEGPVVYFEVRRDGRAQDPAGWLEAKEAR